MRCSVVGGTRAADAVVSITDDGSGAPSLDVAEIADKAGFAAWGSSCSDRLKTALLFPSSSLASFVFVAGIASLSSLFAALAAAQAEVALASALA